jgi:hypothetical protein
MIFSKLFSKEKRTELTMSELLLSTSGSEEKHGPDERPDKGVTNTTESADDHGERPGKCILHAAMGNER